MKPVKTVEEELRERRENRQIREIEYRTVEWPKDALYFSYEPNFLFLGNASVIESCTVSVSFLAETTEEPE
jgi:hypothetical protein